ncbi:MAG: FAD-dependent oxidoreductase, partial [Bdellovibrionales bacterium]|nr:FAD-dependent oxidoreductase [Bdellovibrionales bacterium]
MKEKKKVTVIGSGISGLSVAFYLVRAGYSVTIFEKDNRVGGLLGTKKTPHGVVEQAANAFLANKELEMVSQSIGVNILEKKTTARKRFIFRKGKARRWPLGLWGSLRFLFFILFFSFFKKTKKGQTLKDWAYKSMGKEATHFLLAPAMQGIFVGQPKDLSASLILNALFLNRPPRGQLRGSVCAEFGMGDWTKKMRQYLKQEGCEFILEKEVEDIDLDYPVVLATDLQAAKRIT